MSRLFFKFLFGYDSIVVATALPNTYLWITFFILAHITPYINYRFSENSVVDCSVSYFF